MESLCPKCQSECAPDLQICPSCGVDLIAEETAANLDLTGTVLDGKYQLRDKIGAGAMGAIFQAHHMALDKMVCVKVMHPHVAADPKLVRRFHREARAASSLQHSNIISVLDFGQATLVREDRTEAKLLYLVMEYVQGVDLSDRLKQDQSLEVTTALSIAGQIALALDEAHTKGVVHRDLKPENIMVYAARQKEIGIKVLDFGIAKIMDQGQERGLTRLTMAGTVCGTPEYMSPEQARGKDLDGRTDLYALGVMLYQLLTGSLPFDGDSAIEIVTLHLTEQPVPPTKLNPEIPKEVEELVLDLMNKKVTRRPETALEVAQTCENLREQIIDGSIAIPKGGKATRTIGKRFDGATRVDSETALSKMPTTPPQPNAHSRRNQAQRKTTTDALERNLSIPRTGRPWLPWLLLLSTVSLGTAAVYALNQSAKTPLVPLEAAYPPAAEPSKTAPTDNVERKTGPAPGTSTTPPQSTPTTPTKANDSTGSTPEPSAAQPTAAVTTPTKSKKDAPRRTKTQTDRVKRRPKVKVTQPKLSRAERKSAASALQDQAKAAKKDGDPKAAIGLYEKAYRTYPRARTQFEIGVCYLLLGENGAAEKHMERYLKKLSPKRRDKERPKILLMLGK